MEKLCLRMCRVFLRLPHALALAGALLASFLAVAAEADFGRLESLAEQRYGASGVASVREWRSLIADASGIADVERLRRTNAFFNERTAFQDDSAVWGESDYWATPLETLGKRQGDCEDFAIAKYATLLLLGVPVDKLRLVYVKARIGGPQSRVTQAHMVLAYYANPGAEPLILDNLLGDLLPASRRADLAPVFSFNSAGLWVGSASAPATAAPEQRLSRWREVLQRMRDEGVRWEKGAA
jgi:predicted transglutaminase-like cysteine proteinase